MDIKSDMVIYFASMFNIYKSAVVRVINCYTHTNCLYPGYLPDRVHKLHSVLSHCHISYEMASCMSRLVSEPCLIVWEKLLY